MTQFSIRAQQLAANLAEQLREPRTKRKVLIGGGLAAAMATITAVAVVPMAPDAALLPQEQWVEPLAAPTLAEPIDLKGAEQLALIREERVLRGDSLPMLLTRMGVNDSALLNTIKSDPAAKPLLAPKPGRTIQVGTNDAGQVQWLRYVHTPGVEENGKTVSRYLRISRIAGNGKFADKFVALENSVPTSTRTEFRSGSIRSTLFAATDTAGIPDGVATQLADILSSDIDFHKDLRKNDRFSVVYETHQDGAETVRTGRILALEFVNGNRTFQAVWFDDTGDGKGGYYTFEGKNLKKAFLKSPLEFSRISSGFAMRMHPIHNTWRAHKGVDYAAPTGTPIRTVADGVVDFLGRQNGYGNTVVIKHNGKHSTLYAHMSQFAGIKKGQKIRQGDLIGYVGATGWATGPHLHFEFHQDGVQVDPLKVATPQADPISAPRMAAFTAKSQEHQHQLALLRSVQVALAQ